MKNYDPRQVLKDMCFDRTQASVAQELGITPAYLADILAHRREAGPKVIEALGLEKLVLYRRRNGGK